MARASDPAARPIEAQRSVLIAVRKGVLSAINPKAAPRSGVDRRTHAPVLG
jgi:hypothetical protein